MLREFYLDLHQATAPLYTELYRSEWFFLDIWSFVHFFSGMVLMLLLFGRIRTGVFTALMLLLMAWETFEIGVVTYVENLFRPEILQDQITDIIVGLLGGVAGWLIGYGVRSRPPLGVVSAIGLASLISFLWVVGYGYQYNQAELNTPYFNIWAFAFWSFGLSCVIALDRALEKQRLHLSSRLVLIWTSYLVGLVLIEFIGYSLLGIHEISKGAHQSPLVFGLIHGTLPMKIFYLSIGIVTALLDQAHHSVRWSRQQGRQGI